MAAFSSQKSTFVQKNRTKNVDEIDTRRRTIESFLDVAVHVKEITKAQKRLNVSGGVLSIFGIPH